MFGKGQGLRSLNHYLGDKPRSQTFQPPTLEEQKANWRAFKAAYRAREQRAADKKLA